MTPIVGLLPVSARRLFVYWDAPGRYHGRLEVHAGCVLSGLDASGGCFLDDVRGAVTAELRHAGVVLASTAAITAPADAAGDFPQASR